MHDVHIVGAGPAGCAAAKSACEQGASVILSEEHDSSGTPERCSGLISKTGLDSFGFSYSKSILNRIFGARIYAPSGKCIEVKTKKEVAFVISRSVFDRICAEEAEKAGAKVSYGVRVGKKDLAGKAVVGADGLNSSVAQWNGFPPISSFVSCFQADYERAEVSDRGRVELFFSNSFAPGFFAWVIPLNEQAVRVGVGAFPKANSKKCFETFLKKEIVSAVLKKARLSSSFAYCIPVKPRKVTGKKNIFLVGNAAGQVKATTGGGVFFGGACGRIAGEFAAKGRPAEEYELAWRAKLGNDLLIHERVRAFCNSLSDWQADKYFSLAKLLGAERFLSSYGHMDRPSLMLPHLRMFPSLKAAYSLVDSRVPEGEAYA